MSSPTDRYHSTVTIPLPIQHVLPVAVVLHQLCEFEIVIRPQGHRLMTAQGPISRRSDQIKRPDAHVAPAPRISCFPRFKKEKHEDPKGGGKRSQEKPGHGAFRNQRHVIESVRLHVSHGFSERERMKHDIRVGEQDEFASGLLCSHV